MLAIEKNVMQFSRGKGLPFLFFGVLGPCLGLILALLIYSGNYLYAIALTLAIPFAFVLINYPFSAVVIWLLTMPLMPLLNNTDILYWVIHRLLIPLSLLLAIFYSQKQTGKQNHIKFGLAEFSMLVFLLIVFISIFQTQEGNQVEAFRKAVDRILIPFFLYLLMRFTAHEENSYHFLIVAAFIIALSQSVIGLVELLAPSLLPPAWIGRYGSRRTTGTVIDANLFTSLLIFCICVLIHFAMHHKSGIVRAVIFLVCGLCVTNILFSFQRSSWLGGIFVVLGLLFLYPKTIMRFLALFIVALAILVPMLLSSKITWALQRLQEQRTINDRLVINDALFQMIERKPILGWGYDTVDLNIMHFYRNVGSALAIRRFLTSHNTYLTILVELGPIGFLAYFFPFIYWGIKTVRLSRQLPARGARSRQYLITLWLIVMYIFIVSNTMDMRFFPLGLGLWWMALGCIANLVYPYLDPVLSEALVK